MSPVIRTHPTTRSQVPPGPHDEALHQVIDWHYAMRKKLSEEYAWNADQNPFDPIDGLIQRWGDVVVPIFTGDSRSDQVADGMGSAFVTTLNKRLFLVTAEHVVQQVVQARGVIANIQGKAIVMNGMKFTSISDYDIAATELTEDWARRNGVEGLKAIAAPGFEMPWRKTGVFMLAGYPASKNRLDLRYGKVTRTMTSITAEATTDTANTKIVDFRTYAYDHRNVIDSAQKVLGPQAGLHGMSGGPCMEVLAFQDEEGKFRFSLACAGVMCEWHKDHRLVVAAPPEAIVAVCLHAMKNDGTWSDPPA